jgi:hypothetical protein
MSDAEKKQKPINVVILRSYPKVIFFWPLLITTLIAWPIQMVLDGQGFSGTLLGYIWFIMFFVNLFIIAFDFSSTKFFVLIMAIVVVILLLVFLVLPNISISLGGLTIALNLPSGFYMIMSLVLLFILGFVIISCQFNYWKVERNEIYHKSGIFSSAERYPAKSLRLKKSIPDVFEFFILRAGSITLMPGHGDVIHLTTVLNINKKQDNIDYLLSHVHVEIDELDGT